MQIGITDIVNDAKMKFFLIVIINGTDLLTWISFMI